MYVRNRKKEFSYLSTILRQAAEVDGVLPLTWGTSPRNLFNLGKPSGGISGLLYWPKCEGFYSLISNLKTYHQTLHFTPWSPDLFIHVSFQLPGEHTVLQLFRRIELIVHIVISVLPGTHFHLRQVKHLRVKCLAQVHTILTMSQD